MNWKKWKIGLVVAIFLGLLSAGAGLAAGMSWQAFVAVLCTSLLTHLLAFLKEHPIESVRDESKKTNGGLVLIAIGLMFWAVAAGMIMATFTGCAANQQRISYNSLWTVEKVTTAAFDGYMDSVIRGETKTNDVPKVADAFDTFQVSLLLALDAVEFNTNALAPPSLVIESRDLVNFINQVKKRSAQ